MIQFFSVQRGGGGGNREKGPWGGGGGGGGGIDDIGEDVVEDGLDAG